MARRLPIFQRPAVSTFAVIVAVLVSAGSLIAQPSGATSPDDRKFVLEAAQGSLADVDLSRLATLRGSNDELKQFAQRVVDEHGKAVDELALLARQKGVSLPSALDTKQRQQRDRLAKLSGSAFDRAYIDTMVKDHRKEIATFKKQLERSKDLELKVWAGKTLPTVEERLHMAEDLAARTTGKAGK
jgi:putative membrane protein